MSKRITALELQAAGFVNAIFETGAGEDEKFRQLVLKEVDERLGPHLNGDSLLGIKKLIRQPERETMDSQNSKEVFAGLERFVAGIVSIIHLCCSCTGANLPPAARGIQEIGVR